MPKRDYKAFVWVNMDVAASQITVRAKSKKKARKKVLRKVLEEYVRVSLRSK